jgi:clan AA aspartic protease (TIGR02281 family)
MGADGGKWRGFSNLLAATVVAILALRSLPVQAQVADVGQTIIHWNASNASCRNAATSALEAIGACEQRDRFSKLLAQMNQCYGPSANGVSGWSPCDADEAAQDSALARTTVSFHRRGGVFVLPALVNGSTESYFVVDSGAGLVQIPQETADELTAKGLLGQSDSLGDHGFVVADGRKLMQRTIRLRSVRIGNRTMENVLSSVGAPHSQALLGQSLLRRLNWWKIDNVRNSIELEFTGSF